MWTVLDVQQHGKVLLCVVRWVHPGTKRKPYALAEVSLTEAAVRWLVYATVEASQAELARGCAASPCPL
jgi:hypothetical protein